MEYTSCRLASGKIAVRRWGARGQDLEWSVEVTSREPEDGC